MMAGRRSILAKLIECCAQRRTGLQARRRPLEDLDEPGRCIGRRCARRCAPVQPTPQQGTVRRAWNATACDDAIDSCWTDDQRWRVVARSGLRCTLRRRCTSRLLCGSLLYELQNRRRHSAALCITDAAVS